MTPIVHVLKSKKQAPLASLPPTATVLDALKLLAEREIGAVLIMQGEALLGIFTERDYAR
ncbi:MAG: CBS domain-containing protein, partial [Proteobacteria bacterium]|nr:CBS domain-containing protein [Pseudomonadota bacterium]